MDIQRKMSEEKINKFEIGDRVRFNCGIPGPTMVVIPWGQAMKIIYCSVDDYFRTSFIKETDCICCFWFDKNNHPHSWIFDAKFLENVN